MINREKGLCPAKREPGVPYEGATKGIMFVDGRVVSVTADARQQIREALALANKVATRLNVPY